jgi:hypothetical protein
VKQTVVGFDGDNETGEDRVRTHSTGSFGGLVWLTQRLDDPSLLVMKSVNGTVTLATNRSLPTSSLWKMISSRLRARLAFALVYNTIVIRK